MRVTQDDARENDQIRLFGLTPLQGRSNKYIPDATVVVGGIEHLIELKTSDIAKKQVSTARNVTLPKLEEWRKVWWVFSQYEKAEGGHHFTGEHWIAHGEDLQPWFAKQEKKILDGTPTYGGLNHWNKCRQLLEGKMNDDDLQRLDNSFHKKGCGLNDPKIGWSEVQKLCTRLDPQRPDEHLKEIIGRRA